MARKKKDDAVTEWPKVTIGSHSVRTEYEDGRVDFVTDWEALKRDVREAILKYESNIPAVQTEQKSGKKKNEKKTKQKEV